MELSSALLSSNAVPMARTVGPITNAVPIQQRHVAEMPAQTLDQSVVAIRRRMYVRQESSATRREEISVVNQMS